MRPRRAGRGAGIPARRSTSTVLPNLHPDYPVGQFRLVQDSPTSVWRVRWALDDDDLAASGYHAAGTGYDLTSLTPPEQPELLALLNMPRKKQRPAQAGAERDLLSNVKRCGYLPPVDIDIAPGATPSAAHEVATRFCRVARTFGLFISSAWETGSGGLHLHVDASRLPSARYFVQGFGRFVERVALAAGIPLSRTDQSGREAQCWIDHGLWRTGLETRGHLWRLQYSRKPGGLPKIPASLPISYQPLEAGVLAPYIREIQEERAAEAARREALARAYQEEQREARQRREQIRRRPRGSNVLDKAARRASLYLATALNRAAEAIESTRVDRPGAAFKQACALGRLVACGELAPGVALELTEARSRLMASARAAYGDHDWRVAKRACERAIKNGLAQGMRAPALVPDFTKDGGR